MGTIIDRGFKVFLEESIINTSRLKKGVGKVKNTDKGYLSARGQRVYTSTTSDETSYFKITKKQSIEIMNKLESELNKNNKPIKMTFEEDDDIMEIVPEFEAYFTGGNIITLVVDVRRSDDPDYMWAIVSDSDKKIITKKCHRVIEKWAKEEIYLETPDGEPVNIAKSILKGKALFDDSFVIEVYFSGKKVNLDKSI